MFVFIICDDIATSLQPLCGQFAIEFSVSNICDQHKTKLSPISRPKLLVAKIFVTTFEIINAVTKFTICVLVSCTSVLAIVKHKIPTQPKDLVG